MEGENDAERRAVRAVGIYKADVPVKHPKTDLHQAGTGAMLKVQKKSFTYTA
jgi:hypothetical protein